MKVPLSSRSTGRFRRSSPVVLLAFCLLLGRAGALAHAHEHEAGELEVDCVHCVLAAGVDHAVATAAATGGLGGEERSMPGPRRSAVAVAARAPVARGPPASPFVGR